MKPFLPAHRPVRWIAPLLALSLAIVGVSFGATGAEAATASAAIVTPVTNVVINVDCSAEVEYKGQFVTLAPGVAATIHAINCLSGDVVSPPIVEDAPLAEYSVPAGSTEPNFALVLSGDATFDPTHAIGIYFNRLTTADARPDPSGVLNLSSTSTIAVDTDSFFSAVTAAGSSGSQLGGVSTCGLAPGSHPYATTNLTIGVGGSYTFRVVGTDPASAATTFMTGSYPPITDTFLAVYSAFDPLNPNDNVVGCNDDFDATQYLPDNTVIGGQLSTFSSALAPGNYTLVLTTYANYDEVAGPSARVWSTMAAVDQSAHFELWGPPGGLILAPATTPAMSLALGFHVGSPYVGSTVSSTSTGLKPGSSWSLQLFSEPQTLASGIVDSTGVIASSIVVPAGLALGVHRLLLTGVAPDGSAVTSSAWFTLGANGTILAISLTGPTAAELALAATGGTTDVVGSLLVGGLALLTGLALVAMRRRRAAA